MGRLKERVYKNKLKNERSCVFNKLWGSDRIVREEGYTEGQMKIEEQFKGSRGGAGTNGL